MPTRTRPQSKHPRKARLLKAAEAGVRAAQSVFAKVIEKADPKAKKKAT